MRLSKFFPVLIIALLALAVPSFVMTSYTSPPAANGVGIRSYVRQAANLPITSSTVLINTDLSVPVAVGDKFHIKYVVPFTLGGTAPGIKFQVTAPATPSSFVSVCTVFASTNAVALESVITTAAAQGVTLATAANHHAVIELDYTATVAGTIVLQFAQNVSDAAATTVLKGAYAEVVKL